MSRVADGCAQSVILRLHFFHLRVQFLLTSALMLLFHPSAGVQIYPESRTNTTSSEIHVEVVERATEAHEGRVVLEDAGRGQYWLHPHSLRR